MTDQTCPRCGSSIKPGSAARSRVDGTTRICSDCGTKEAMLAFEHPDLDLPPLDQQVPTSDLGDETLRLGHKP